MSSFVFLNCLIFITTCALFLYISLFFSFFFIRKKYTLSLVSYKYLFSQTASFITRIYIHIFLSSYYWRLITIHYYFGSYLYSFIPNIITFVYSLLLFCQLYLTLSFLAICIFRSILFFWPVLVLFLTKHLSLSQKLVSFKKIDIINVYSLFFMSYIILDPVSRSLFRSTVYFAYIYSCQYNIDLTFSKFLDTSILSVLNLFPFVIDVLICDYLRSHIHCSVRVYHSSTCRCGFNTVNIDISCPFLDIKSFRIFSFPHCPSPLCPSYPSAQINQSFPVNIVYDIHTSSHSFIITSLNNFMKRYYNKLSYIPFPNRNDYSFNLFSNYEYFDSSLKPSSLHIKYLCILSKILIRNLNRSLRQLNYDLTHKWSFCISV